MNVALGYQLCYCMSMFWIMAMYLTILFLLCFYLVYLIYRLWPVVRYAKQPLPFLPIPQHIAKAIAQLPELDNKKRIVDLGCGRGHLLLAIHRYHPTAKLFGVEYNPKLVKSLPGMTITQGDMFTYDISTMDAIVGWWVPKFCERLVTKFAQECQPDCVVVSYMFPLPNHPRFTHRVVMIGKEKVFVYSKI